MLNKIFFEHPREVGESYGEHLGVASRFGFEMVIGGIGCMIHSLIPAIFVTAGSDTVARLHKRMVAQRAAKRAANIEAATVEWVI